MRWIWGFGVLFVLLGAWLVRDALRSDPQRVERGPEGIDFVIPGDYRILPLGETTLPQAAATLLDSLAGGPRLAVEFTDRGDRIQILVDRPEDVLEVRLQGREGTVRLEIWRGPVAERLRWATGAGNLAAPGLPAAERRNPYH